MKTQPDIFNVNYNLVRRCGADKPVQEKTVVPSVDGFPGSSDEVTLQPGQWLEVVENGSPEAWSKAVIRQA